MKPRTSMHNSTAPNMNSSTTRNRNSVTTPSTPPLVTTHSEWTWSTKIPQDTQSMEIDSPDTCYDSDDFDFLSDDEIDQILNTYQAKINRQVIDKDIIENQVSVLELERSLARQREYKLLQELKKIEQFLSLS